jgi:MerR family mercuric resistance operon transcriptional regulator
MDKTRENLTIGALARCAGVHVETIRFYQRRGLLAQPRRPLGGIRRYDRDDLARIRFIKTAQRLGFSLDEVGALLRLEDGLRCGEARALAEHKLADVRLKLGDLQRIAAVLSELVRRCRRRKGDISCPLIASLHDGT